MPSPGELVALLDLVSGLGAEQVSLLLLGIIFSIMSSFCSSLSSPLWLIVNKVITTAVWAVCWLCLPNALVRSLFPLGPHIIKKTSENPSSVSMAFSRYYLEPEAAEIWDG